MLFLLVLDARAQDTTAVQTVRIEDPLLGPVVPLDDTAGFQRAIRAREWNRVDGYIRRLVRSNGHVRKVKYQDGKYRIMSLNNVPSYLMDMPEVRLCLLMAGPENQLLLVVEYAEGVGRKNRVYQLRRSHKEPLNNSVPRTLPKGRWKVVGIAE